MQVLSKCNISRGMIFGSCLVSFGIISLTTNHPSAPKRKIILPRLVIVSVSLIHNSKSADYD